MLGFTDAFINRLYARLTEGKECVPEEKAKEVVINLQKYREEEIKKKKMKQNVFKSSVQRKVDGDIVKHLTDHKSIVTIQSDLSNRMVGMKFALTKVNPDRKVDLNLFNDENWIDKIDNIREQYFLYYIYFLNKRICDLQWILDKRFRGQYMKFSHLWNHQYFKMLKLKEHLDPKEEALV